MAIISIHIFLIYTYDLMEIKIQQFSLFDNKMVIYLVDRPLDNVYRRKRNNKESRGNFGFLPEGIVS